MLEQIHNFSEQNVAKPILRMIVDLNLYGASFDKIVIMEPEVSAYDTEFGSASYLSSKRDITMLDSDEHEACPTDRIVDRVTGSTVGLVYEWDDGHRQTLWITKERFDVVSFAIRTRRTVLPASGD